MDFIRYVVRRRADKKNGEGINSLSAESFQENGKLRAVLG